MDAPVATKKCSAARWACAVAVLSTSLVSSLAAAQAPGPPLPPAPPPPEGAAGQPPFGVPPPPPGAPLWRPGFVPVGPSDRISPPPHRVDPLLPTGIVLTSAGATLAIFGGMALGSGNDQVQVCGLNGCVNAEYASESTVRGRAVLAAGLGMAAVGIPAMFAGAGSGPAIGERANEGSLVVGTWLAGVGVSTAAFGIVHAVGSSGQSGEVEGDSASIPIAVGGGVVAAVGGILAATGAPRTGRPDVRKRLASPARVYVGMSLATLGAVAGVAGAYSVAVFGDEGGMAGLGIAVISMPVLAGAAGLMGAGIPVWATGARTVPDVPVPEVSLGPTGGSMRWRF